MTPQQREILDAMTPGVPISARQIARRVFGHERAQAVVSHMAALVASGFVEKTYEGTSRGAKYTRPGVADRTSPENSNKRTSKIAMTTPANSCQESRHVRVNVALEPFDIPPPPPEPGTLAYHLLQSAARRAEG